MKKNDIQTKDIVVFVLGIIGAIIFVLRCVGVIPQIRL